MFLERFFNDHPLQASFTVTPPSPHNILIVHLVNDRVGTYWAPYHQRGTKIFPYRVPSISQEYRSNKTRSRKNGSFTPVQCQVNYSVSGFHKGDIRFDRFPYKFSVYEVFFFYTEVKMYNFISALHQEHQRNAAM